MVESSFPPSRVGAAAVPNSIFLTRQRMIPFEMPDADSAVPQSPVSGNFPSARGLPLAGSGTGSTPRPSGSRSYPPVLYVPWPARRPVRPAPCRPCCCAFWQSISLPCRGIWGIKAALRSLSQRVTPAAVMLAAASSQEERHRLGRLLSPLWGWPAPSRLAATGYELWCWPS